MRTVAVVALAFVGASCSSEPDVEKVPVGTEVQLTRQDGGVVEGKLAAKDEQAVRVDVGPTTRAVPKDEIAVVRVVDRREGARPIELPARAKFREYTLPSGTKLHLELESPVSSETSEVESPVEARVAAPILINGVEVVPAGSRVTGEVTTVVPAGKVKGRASLVLSFNRLAAGGDTYPIAAQFAMTAPSTKKDDAAKIGIPAAGGAIIGAIVGGKKGAAIGAAVGGGAGTATVLLTEGKDVALGRGAEIAVTLTEPVDVKVPIRSN
jgi:hypothetical protein